MGLHGLPDKPKGFPKKSKYPDLETFLLHTLNYIETNTDHHAVFVANHYIEITQRELQLRDSLRASRISIRLSWATMVLAGLTIALAIININFQSKDQQFDASWLQKQEQYNNKLIEKIDNFYKEYSTKLNTIKLDTTKRELI